MSDLLNRFYNDEHTRNELIDFLNDFIDSEGLRRMYNREDVSAVADAKELIERAFSELENLYAPKQRTPKKESPSK
jgi:hypothetical protein